MSAGLQGEVEDILTDAATVDFATFAELVQRAIDQGTRDGFTPTVRDPENPDQAATDAAQAAVDRALEEGRRRAGL